MKGIYILLIKLKKDSKIRTKSVTFNLKKGNYVYIGSAENNLEKRINRHKSKSKKLHWHIDFLLKNKNAKIIDVYTKKADKKQECLTAKRLSKSNIEIKNFGCSDCSCYSHLIKLNNNIS